MSKACVHGHENPPRYKNGLCILCGNEYSKQWYIKNKDKFNTRRKKEYKDGKSTKIKAKVREAWRIKKGISEPTRPTPEVCECCGKPDTKALALDHNHATGKFRGWLCSLCNTGIGALGDDIKGLQQAVRYLEKVS